MAKILVATNNDGKLNEIRGILGPLGIEVVAPSDVGGLPDIPETGKTFEENARLKAMAAAGMKQMPALADDSGLEVFALDGEPGIRSARYAGPDATDDDRMSKLLENLADKDDRSARFVCVVALATPQGVLGTAEGEIRGSIVDTPTGDGGFGYDPLFAPEGHEKTFGQISLTEKHAMSHRGNALRNAIENGLFKLLPTQALFKDSLSKSPGGNWLWIREQRDAWWVLDGALQIKALPGTLWQERNNARNVLVRSVPDKPVAIEMMVTNGPKVQGEQAGLVYMIDDDNYVKIVKEYLDGEVWIVLAREVNGDAVPINKIPADCPTATVCLEVNGNQFSGKFKRSLDGEYIDVGECTADFGGTGLRKVGIVCHGAEDEESARRAQFRQFKITEL